MTFVMWIFLLANRYTVQVVVFWVMTPDLLVRRYHLLWWTYCFHLLSCHIQQHSSASPHRRENRRII